MSDSVAVPTPTPFEARIAQAAKVMGISVQCMWAHLGALGVENNPDGQSILDAETTQEGDARAIMVEGKGMYPVGGVQPDVVKIARFKAGWAVLKGKAGMLETAPSGGVTSLDVAGIVNAIRPVAQYSDEELLAKYDGNCSTEVMDALKTRGNNRSFIVFKRNGEIDATVSLRLLRKARREETPSTFMVDGALVHTHRVGEFPMNFTDECPLNPDYTLVEDFCEPCGNTWEGIKHEDRVIVRVARDLDAIDYHSLHGVQNIIEKTRREGAGWILAIPAVKFAYEELKEDGKLPILRRRVSKSHDSKSDPFHVRH